MRMRNKYELTAIAGDGSMTGGMEVPDDRPDEVVITVAGSTMRFNRDEFMVWHDAITGAHLEHRAMRAEAADNHRREMAALVADHDREMDSLAALHRQELDATAEPGD